QARGQGLPRAFPPLAGSDFLMADKDRSIDVVLHGLHGPVTVNGERFDGVMPPLAYLSDDEIADVLTYVRSAWGNAADPATATQVADKRAGRSAQSVR